MTNSHFSVITSWSFSFFSWLQSFHSRSEWRTTHLPPQPIRTRQSWGSSWRRNCRETEHRSLRSRSLCWRKVTACVIHTWCCSVALALLPLAMIDGWSEWSDDCHKFPLFYFWLAILIGSAGNVDFLHKLKFKGQFTKFLKNYSSSVHSWRFKRGRVHESFIHYRRSIIFQNECRRIFFTVI